MEPAQADVRPPTLSGNGSNRTGRSFEVEKVIGHREVFKGSKSSAEYLVLWLGYPIDDASWEPWKNLKSCEQLVHDYHNRVSKMLSRRYPPQSPTHRMSLRRLSTGNGATKSRGVSSSDSGDEWQIEAILGHELIEHANDGKKMHYEVKWVGVEKPIMTKESLLKNYDSTGVLHSYMMQNNIVYEEVQNLE